MNGKPEIAKNALWEALRLFPKYHYALGNLVKVHVAQNPYDNAVVAAQAFYTSAPHPENLFVLAETFAKAKNFPNRKPRLRNLKRKRWRNRTDPTTRIVN